MKTKKLLSVLSAAAVSATMLSGLAVTASAAGEDINLTFAGNTSTDTTKPLVILGERTDGSTTSLHSGMSNVDIESTLDEDVKSLFDGDSDGVIDSQYTEQCFWWAGNGSTVNTEVDLAQGTYTVYYLSSNNNRGINASLSTSGAGIIMGGDVITVGNGMYAYVYTIVLTSGFNGYITFANDSSSLPDPYSVKIVDDDPYVFKTQNDPITAEDIVGTATRTTFHNEGYTLYDNLSDETRNNLIQSFGNNLSGAGALELSNTNSDNNYFYINVTENGNYAIDLLGTTTRDQKLTFAKAENTEDVVATIIVSEDGGYTNVATANESGGPTIRYMTTSGTVELAAGLYKVGITKNRDPYYNNFIAMALREVSEPQPETLDMTNEGVSTGNDGSVATSFTAQISNFSGYAGTPKTVTVTSGVNSMPIEINSTVIAEGNTIYALIVNNLNDADAKAVITFE